MKKELFKFIVLLMVALGAGPVGAAIWQWSLTPASNGTADPTINWAVGMAPSAVDPSARAMMARIAEWRDDTSGALPSAGTATAYTVTTNESSGGNGICGSGTTPNNGTALTLTMNVTNGASPTLAPDGCTAAPIQMSSGAAVTSGTLVSGTPYRFTYSTANVAWMLQGFFSLTPALSSNPFGIPLGGMLPYTLSTAPNSNFILPAGQCISTTTYATYWALLGSPAPGGCGAGTFAVIDLRGRVLAALDNLNGSSASRLTSAATGCGTAMTSIAAVCASAGESQTLITANLPPYTPSGSINFTSQNANIRNSFNFGAGGVPGAQDGAATISASFGGNAQGGTSTPFSRVQPTIAVGYLLRVL